MKKKFQLRPYYTITAIKDGERAYLDYDGDSGYPYWRTWGTPNPIRILLSAITTFTRDVINNNYMKHGVEEIAIAKIETNLTYVKFESELVAEEAKNRALDKLTKEERELLKIG